MSNRTIVEFNHDFAHQIQEDGVCFLQLLGQALRSGDVKDWKLLERYGVRYGVWTHHSTPRQIVTKHLKVEF